MRAHAFTTAPVALRCLASDLMGPEGLEVERRGGRVREFEGPVSFSLASPRSRLAALAGRGLDPWVALAEFPWLIAGRNDIAWLEHYLPRAKDFSDDGLTWRAGYGPRLRNWVGFEVVADQLAEVVARLASDPQTRQAVAVLWDPASDNVQGSLDYPCSNMLHFWRNALTGALDLHVVMRSNDLIWGASGVNIVNFTLLQELVAACLGWPLGIYHHTANNLHLYERHWAMATSLRGPDLYAFAKPGVLSLRGGGPLDRLSNFTVACKEALEYVQGCRGDEDAVAAIENLARLRALRASPWVADWAHFMLLRDPVRRGALASLAGITHEDWRAAGVQFGARRAKVDSGAVSRILNLGASSAVREFVADAMGEAEVPA